MIRFMPDTWREALLRPLAMAAPDGGVYVEIMAPDFRFAFIVALAIVLAIAGFWLPRKLTSFKPTALLLLVTLVAFVPWLLTTGNGRYFLPFLLIAGPLCVALVFLLPMTQGFRFALSVCLVAVQAFVVYEADPFKSWSHAQWTNAPYYQVNVPSDMIAHPQTYVTISSISYSLIAPLFHPGSRWINLSNAPLDRQSTVEGRLVNSILTSSLDLTLIVPTIPGAAMAKGLPNAEVVRAINVLLSDHQLAIDRPESCRFLRSDGLVSKSVNQPGSVVSNSLDKAGFWACPMKYPVGAFATRLEIVKSQFDAVFDKVETLCPRFFRSGEAKTRVINGGELREYGGSDMKVYVSDDGTVMYKYYRSFAPQLIGQKEDVLSGKIGVNCDKIRSRSGLPWEKDI